VKSLYENETQWIDAPPIENTFIINLGDALEHATNGIYRATPHRVLQRNHATADRLSLPYFFDPSFDADMKKIVTSEELAQHQFVVTTQHNIKVRWDKMDPRLFEGKYGNYLLNKVSKAFPQLFAEVVEEIQINQNQEL
jgi:isopenicillin N synthase-like dioxygenase